MNSLRGVIEVQNRIISTMVMCAILSAVCGCLPRVSVRPNPGPCTPGIRYYRPKPYLFISPAAESVAVEKKEDKTVTTTEGVADKYVQIQLQWLPDFSEEYAINIRSGLGTNETEITLENGWNLTGLNTKLDSQTDENITAVAELIKAIPTSAATRFAGDKVRNEAEAKVVRATNVPLGYYESVIGRDKCGKKQFYGWRYVGFAPFNGCPIKTSGQDCMPCNAMDLYGLTFDNGIMTFKRLHKVEEIGQRYNYETTPAMPTLPDRNGVPGRPTHSEEIHELPVPLPLADSLPTAQRGTVGNALEGENLPSPQNN